MQRGDASLIDAAGVKRRTCSGRVSALRLRLATAILSVGAQEDRWRCRDKGTSLSRTSRGLAKGWLKCESVNGLRQ